MYIEIDRKTTTVSEYQGWDTLVIERSKDYTETTEVIIDDIHDIKEVYIVGIDMIVIRNSYNIDRLIVNSNNKYQGMLSIDNIDVKNTDIKCKDMHVIDSNLGNRTIDVMNKPMYENTT
jgi:hypothetical protein